MDKIFIFRTRVLAMQEKLYLKDSPLYHCFAVPGCSLLKPQKNTESLHFQRSSLLLGALGRLLERMFDRFKNCLLLMYVEIKLYLGFGKVLWVKRYSVLQEFLSNILNTYK